MSRFDLRLLAIGLAFVMPLVTRAEEPAATYRVASYAIETSGDGRDAVRWSYPVMLQHPAGGLKAVNAWIRMIALEPLRFCTPLEQGALQRMTDRQIVNELARTAGLAECGLLQAGIEPVEAFGDYLSFRRSREVMGSARPQQGSEVLVFELRADKVVSASQFFKPGSLDALNGLLAEKLPERPDCHGRSFDWTQVQLRPPRQVIIEFPYNPAEWAACGDGLELIEGPEVTKLLAAPRRLKPARKLLELR